MSALQTCFITTARMSLVIARGSSAVPRQTQEIKPMTNVKQYACAGGNIWKSLKLNLQHTNQSWFCLSFSAFKIIWLACPAFKEKKKICIEFFTRTSKSLLVKSSLVWYRMLFHLPEFEAEMYDKMGQIISQITFHLRHLSSAVWSGHQGATQLRGRAYWCLLL